MSRLNSEMRAVNSSSKRTVSSIWTSTTVAPAAADGLRPTAARSRRPRALAAGQTPHADAGAPQGVPVEPVHLRLVGGDRASGGVARVRPLDHVHRDRRVDDVAGHRAGRVLLGGDGYDPGPAHEAERGLVADHAVDAGRADDRAVGLRADRRPGRSAAATAAPEPLRRSAGVAIEDVGVVGLATDGAPAGGGEGATEVGPLGEVRLAEDDRTGGAEPAHELRVLGRARPEQRPRPGRVCLRSGCRCCP